MCTEDVVEIRPDKGSRGWFVEVNGYTEKYYFTRWGARRWAHKINRRRVERIY